MNDPDFHIDAREAYRYAAGWGFTDVFRQLHPDRVQYTYWDYFRNAFEHNWGWRIDHIMVDRAIGSRLPRQRRGPGNPSRARSIGPRRGLGGVRCVTLTRRRPYSIRPLRMAKRTISVEL